MKNITSTLVACVVMAGVFLIPGSSPAQEDSEAVLQVIRIDTHGNTSAYITSLKAVLDRLEELSPESSSRVWEATLAGDSTGAVYVVTEYSSLAAFAAANAETVADEALAEGIAALAATGRTVESTSILTEITP